MRNLAVVASLAAVLALPSISRGQPAPPVSAKSTDEQTILAIHERWAGLIRAKDAAAIERLYADDAVLMAPGERAVAGSAAIGARWARQLQLKDFKFSLQPQQLVVSMSADLAYERGTYNFAATLAQGAITDTGKYVLVWQKARGEWKVISDIFNSNPPAEAR